MTTPTPTTEERITHPNLLPGARGGTRLGCMCQNVEIGSHGVSVLMELPGTMLAQREARIAQGLSPLITVDACLVEEIRGLWSKGIRTTGCCCGHNKEVGFIGVIPEDIPHMKALGYVVRTNNSRPGAEDGFIPKSTRATLPTTAEAVPGNLTAVLVQGIQMLSAHIERFHDHEEETEEKVDIRGIKDHLEGAALVSVLGSIPNPSPSAKDGDAVPPLYLIRKGGAFYRPNSQGYTRSIAEAGRYSLAEAEAITHPNGPDGPRDGMDYIPAPASR